MKIKNLVTCIVPLLFFTINLSAQERTMISTSQVRMTTYPFSDPDPLPSNQKIYPYFRFDGFSNKSIQKDWKVITLENEYIRVEIMPEIGGKIWSAYDKVNKRNYIYNNAVVKFRDIAMRGPWTSGGIEANYGVIGHTPNTSTPVDYLTKNNPDGSASCFIHTLDLISRTRWTLEIILEKDKAYFSTKSFWSNNNPIEQTYYTWMNLGVPTKEDLQFIYPGNKYIGHDGKEFSWPIDPKGNNLSNYKENAFGGSKSYHVLGAPSNVFGAYYQTTDQGMVRYANREEKLGKKIFLWAQSGSGNIWENLLTDNSGQYAEIQSGRLFNQNAYTSSETPFKQTSFLPYQSDRWEEYWIPFKGVGKPTAVNLIAAFNIQQIGKKLIVKIDPKQEISDTLLILDENGNLLGSSFITGKIGSPLNTEIILSNKKTPKSIILKGTQLDIDLNTQVLSRPTVGKTLQNDLDSLVLLGRDLLRFHLFAEAEPVINKTYKVAPNRLDVLLSMIKLNWFKMDYLKAYDLSTKALAIDTYDPEANYYYGLLAKELGKYYDALDGFQVASMNPHWRTASYIELSKLSLGRSDFKQAKQYVQKAMLNGQDSPELLQILYLSYSHLNEGKEASNTLAKLRKMDPLNPFLNFEEYWLKKEKQLKQHFLDQIQQELRIEAFLELAIWYQKIGFTEKAITILEIAPQNIETLYWLAWLNQDNSNEAKWITLAEKADLDFVFPFREESNKVLNWVAQNHNHWKSSYLQAVLLRNRNQANKSFEILTNNLNEKVSFAPYFTLLSQLNTAKDISKSISYLNQAIKIDSKEWRYGKLLSNLYLKNKDYENALTISSSYYKVNPNNYILGMNYVKMLLLNGKYTEAEKILSTLEILPFEGATDGHRYFEQAKLMLAYQAWQNKNYGQAHAKIKESRLWPTNLGVGEPYDAEKQEILADWLSYHLLKTKDKSKANSRLIKIIQSKKPAQKSLIIIQAVANELLGNKEKAVQLETELLNEKDPFIEKLSKQIKHENLETYWPKIISMIYQGEDQRMF